MRELKTKQPTFFNQKNLYLRYSDKDLAEFKKILLKKLKIKKEELALQKGHCINQNGTQDSAPGYKKIEDAGETFSNEYSTRTIIRMEKFIRDLNNALLRIENKTYGICRVTGKLIQRERLKLVSHATLSMEAKNRKDGFIPKIN